MPSDHNLYLSKSREQKEYYNKTAADYNHWHVETSSARIVDAWNFQNLQDFIGTNKIVRALDLGCGTGRLAQKLSSLAEEVYGLDYSEEVLKIAAAKYPQLKLTCGQVVDLPYADNFFDLVVINGSLHHFFAVKETIQEVYRVLKPGGYFALLGEPNKNFLKINNPFFYIWFLDRVFIKIFSFLKIIKINPEEIEPEAEAYRPAELLEAIYYAGFKVNKFYTYDYLPRWEQKWWIQQYPRYLKWENRYLGKIFRYKGLAIQAFVRK